MTGSVLTDLKLRGVVADQTHPDLDKVLASRPMTVYAGFDPTADSLHVGNLSIIMLLRRFQRFGHKPLALVGGGTGMIGDPSGKEHERQLQTRAEVERKSQGLRAVLARFLAFGDGPSDAALLDNYDWLGSLNLIEFLRDIGKHFRVQDMVARESVRRRLEKQEGISFTEFTYQLLQSYDFWHLFKHHGCELQVGGSDQWGNITAGTDLIRELEGKPAYGITGHLVTRADGSKFGKSDDGKTVVWLSAEKTSPFDYYQFWLRSDDRDVMRYVKIFTDIDAAEWPELERTLRDEPEKRVAHHRLAFEATTLAHGDEEARRAREAADAAYSGNRSAAAFDAAPTTSVERARIETGFTAAEAFELCGLVPSRGEARRKAQAGALRINDRRVDDAMAKLRVEDFDEHGRCVLQFGKQKLHVLRIDPA